MGTTLSNGVYLPDEGERNCYAGLKVNWEILNQKVADIVALQSAIAGALHREIVASLPTTDIDTATIYMILNGTSATENVYDEYMYINNAWELIGASATDLTNYYTKGDVDGLLVLKANASDLTSHTGDTTIHVTASDKAKWNTVALIKQLRLVNTQVGSATTIAFANIDDTNGIKVGDKCMDLDAKMFEITAVDTTNETVTVGSALIDLAQDSDVVHKSGNETISGGKTFSSNVNVYNSNPTATTPNLYLRSSKIEISSQGNTSGGQNLTYLDKNNVTYAYVQGAIQSNGSAVKIRAIAKDSSDNSVVNELQLLAYTNGNKAIFPTYSNEVDLGVSSYKWKSVYATNYYYGSNNVEFSTKFVTTDTAQDISANKNFKGIITTIPNETLWPADTNTTADITSLGGSSIHIEYKASGKLTDLSGGAWTVVELGEGCFFFRINNGTDIRYKHFPTNLVNRIPVVSGANRFINDVTPNQDNTYDLGSSSLRWATINGLNPSSLGMPDLSNGIDISSYITVNGGNKESLYTPPSNGWISVALTRAGGVNMAVMLKQGNFASSGHNIQQENGTTTCSAMLPVKGGVQVSINRALADGIDFAYFYPCQGNV